MKKKSKKSSVSDASDSTATLEDASEPKAVTATATITVTKELDPPLPPEPVIKGKKSNVPFSRIPKDTYVDPKFSTNAFHGYDYARQAHEKLIVTKGKGFTKEKNKGKRGSYRGGLIDVNTKHGIKFDD